MKATIIESERRIVVPSAVRRITVLHQNADGTIDAEVVYRSSTSRGRRKTSRMFRTMERAARRAADAQSRFAQSYLDRHERSNRRRRDGWIGDYPSNVLRASQKGMRALRLNRLVVF
jgi:hypothetical protein